jgi:hypothetical protein
MIPEAMSIDESLEYTKELIQKNTEIIANQSSMLFPV